MSFTGLQYLDQVIKESLRIYPPATLFTSRICNMDYQVGSITIHKGSAVVVPVWDIHHDPDLWPNPKKFDPDRFSPANKASLKSMAYMPFGLGKRNCIGNRFAISEVKIAIFRLLKEFKFETCEKTEDPLTLVCTTTVIGPANGIYLRAVPRSEAV
ncbi:Cytochrome P450 9e2 [Araneus ventricosus]|uniref:Cytochrome P450 9e2 n=1 Tax=Araneus ventricosus TaxID=182803 RepID=A0A4Y2KDM4_ARAVE|nr:Cytochrome P450 9e2 [Araneus ventricosus]